MKDKNEQQEEILKENILQLISVPEKEFESRFNKMVKELSIFKRVGFDFH